MEYFDININQSIQQSMKVFIKDTQINNIIGPAGRFRG